LLFALVFLLQTAPGPTCADAAECRAQAESAAARADYESFHDLAWRAVQKGKRNDTDLMFLLARAQSLSGRPVDARVMLDGVGARGRRPDGATTPVFARVGDLARYWEVAAMLSSSPPPALRPPADPPASAARVTADKPTTARDTADKPAGPP